MFKNNGHIHVYRFGAGAETDNLLGSILFIKNINLLLIWLFDASSAHLMTL